jgi:hypothetical protein
VLVVYRLKMNKKKTKINGGCCENSKFLKKGQEISALKILILCPLVLLVRVRWKQSREFGVSLMPVDCGGLQLRKAVESPY